MFTRLRNLPQYRLCCKANLMKFLQYLWKQSIICQASLCFSPSFSHYNVFQHRLSQTIPQFQQKGFKTLQSHKLDICLLFVQHNFELFLFFFFFVSICTHKRRYYNAMGGEGGGGVRCTTGKHQSSMQASANRVGIFHWINKKRAGDRKKRYTHYKGRQSNIFRMVFNVNILSLFLSLFCVSISSFCIPDKNNLMYSTLRWVCPIAGFGNKSSRNCN